MARVTDIEGVAHEVSCIACAIQSGALRLPVERISETEHFVVEQDLEYPIEGFLVIVAKRHVVSAAEFSEAEGNEFIGLLIKTRSVLSGLGIEYVTLVQEETSKTSHFHIWLFPWHAWMLLRRKGKLGDIKPIMAEAKAKMSEEETLARVRETAVNIKDKFQSL